MKMDWYDGLPKLAQQVIDQAGHALLGGGVSALIGAPLLLQLPGWTAGMVGSIMGCFTMGLYELLQNLGDLNNDYLDMAIDLAFGCGSAVLVGIIIWAVA